MLVAYGPGRRPVVANENSLEQLQRWSHERALFCPNCRGLVHVRGGPEKRTQLHFAHQKGECAWSTEAESVRHARGKMVIAEWLRKQFPKAEVTLEERLPGPNRIADIFMVSSDGQRWAIEFQCAPLDLEEWRHRHYAYQKANIYDTWIVGNNRREKQEAFIEAIIATAHEVMFLDPLVTPPRTWLRWVVARDIMVAWQRETKSTPSFEGWVGHSGYEVSLVGQLQDVQLGERGRFSHPVRSALVARTQLLGAMSNAQAVDEVALVTYLRASVDEESLRIVLIPLIRVYLRDPDLLQRYNYGRGRLDQPCREEDRQRILQARAWLSKLAGQGFPAEKLRELAREIPFIGPYADFAGFIEMLAAL